MEFSMSLKAWGNGTMEVVLEICRLRQCIYKSIFLDWKFIDERTSSMEDIGLQFWRACFLLLHTERFLYKPKEFATLVIND
jgi:hypothetical protein